MERVSISQAISSSISLKSTCFLFFLYLTVCITQSPSIARKPLLANISAIVDFPLPQVPLRIIILPPLQVCETATSAPQRLHMGKIGVILIPVSYTHLRAHETDSY